MNGTDGAAAIEPNWFSTAGRRARLSFFGNFLFVNIGVGVITAVAGGVDGLLAPLVAVACSIIGGWVNICLTTQRLHDIGRTGWVQAIPFAAMIPALALAARDELLAVLIGVGCLLLASVGFLLWLMLMPGTQGSNAFGSPP